MGLVPGQWINRRYRLLSLLGGGGMGKVWLARDETLDREVAIKEVAPAFAVSPEHHRELHERALREARAAGGLKHPGIVTVHDVLQRDGSPLIIMEVIRGPSLEERIRHDGPLPAAEAVRVGRVVLDALRAAHAKKITHRDVKPSNILFEGDRVVLTDFGIALLHDDTFTTREDSVLGTPAFMAPEQARYSQVTPAADLWSLGATLFYAVQGRPPLAGRTRAAILGELVSDRPVPRAVAAGPLAPVIDALLQKDPGARPSGRQTAKLLDWAAGQLGDSVRGTLELPSQRRERRHGHRRLTALLLGVALAAGAFFLIRPVLEREKEPVNYESLITLAIKGIYQPFAFRPGKGDPSFAVSEGNTILLYDLDSFPEARRLGGHEGPIRGFAFDPEGTLLASFSDDSSIRIWGLDDPERDRLLPGHQGSVIQTVFGSDSLLLSSDAAANPSFKLWDLKSGHQITSIVNLEEAADLAFDSDHRPFGLEARENEILVWNLTERTSRALRGHEDLVTVSEFAPGARTVVTASDDQTLRIWRLEPDGDPSGQVIDDREGVDRIAFSPDGRTFATAGALAENARLWRDDGSEAGPPKVHGSRVTALAFSPDGETIATGGDDHAVRLWSLAEEQPRIELNEHGASISQIEFSSDGRYLAAVDLNGVAKIWRLSP